MGIKNKFSFNEKEEAERIVTMGFENNVFDPIKVYMVAKYFAQEMGYGKVRLEKEIIKFCKKYNPSFNQVTESENIKKWVKAGLSYRLRETCEINITSKEMNFLNSIQEKKDQRLLFSMLLISKSLSQNISKVNKARHPVTEKKYYLKYSSFTDVIKVARVSNFKDTDLCDLIFKYKNNFTFYSPEKELIRLDFAGGDDVVETIYDFSDVKKLYEEIFEKDKIEARNKEKQGNTLICKICGKEVERINQRQIYCKNCSLNLSRESKRKWATRKRENNNNE